MAGEGEHAAGGLDRTRADTSRRAFRSMFKRLDVDDDGKLTVAELIDGMQKLRVPCTSKEAERMLARTGRDPAHLTAAEFEAIAVEKLELMAGVYDAIDRNNDGRLSSAELRQGCYALGLKVSDDNLRAWTHLMDDDRDGQISFEEFCGLLSLLPDANPKAVYEHFAHEVYYETADARNSQPVDVVRVNESQGASAVHFSYARAVIAQLSAGGIAGGVSRTATAPIDRVKMLLQAAPPGASSGGILPTLRSVYAEGGAAAFFRGNGANVLKVAPETATKFLVFDAAKKWLSADAGSPTVGERFAAGAVAGATAQAAVYPLEVAKTRLAVSAPGAYAGTFDCLRSVAATDGVRGLFRGLGASLGGIIPYAGIDLMVMSLLKDRVAASCEAQGTEPGVGTLLACGATSSVVAMAATYPLNLVRTRMQLGGAGNRSPADVVRSTLRAEGWRGLYRGVGVNAAKVLPSTAISYAVYESAKRALLG